MVQGPLSKRRIAITRPLAQCAPLADELQQLGAEVITFPLLQITALDKTDQRENLRRCIAQLSGYDMAIFISPNAVHHAFAAVEEQQGKWSAHTTMAVVGSGSAHALATRGFQALHPANGEDSESLLALPQFAAEKIERQKIILFRGDSGRELLSDSLRERGAQLDVVACYQRSAPPLAARLAFVERIARREIDALTVSSSEAIRHLSAAAPCHHSNAATSHSLGAFLYKLPLFVTHPRIAHNAQTLGFQRIITAGAARHGLAQALCAYNWTHDEA